ncbi:MAG: hypothetical protein RJA81_405 [Planctomycetota bacterium]
MPTTDFRNLPATCFTGLTSRRSILKRAFGTAVYLASPAAAMGGDASPWTVSQTADGVDISLGGQKITTFVKSDRSVRRPFFRDVHTPQGFRVTRTYPPLKGVEDTDHETMHPGIWLAFGRLNGQDYWRNRSEILSESIQIEKPADDHSCAFSTISSYLKNGSSQPAIRETTRHEFRKNQHGIEWTWTTKLEPLSGILELGHQEEMGLGVRLSNPLTVKRNGSAQMTNSQMGVNEKGTWGKPAQWWLAFETDKNGRKTGIRIDAKTQPDMNFWGHTRDYGLIVANPTSIPGEGPDLRKIAGPLTFHFRICLFDSYQGIVADL